MRKIIPPNHVTKKRKHTLRLLQNLYWHEYLEMVYYFKVTHGLINYSYLPLKNTTSYTRSSSNKTSTPKYVVPPCKRTTHQRLFWIRSIRTWNTLVDKLDLSMNSLKFRSAMLNYYFTALEKMYDCEDPRTFKTICPRCNNSRSLIGPISCCYGTVIIILLSIFYIYCFQFFVGLQ